MRDLLLSSMTMAPSSSPSLSKPNHINNISNKKHHHHHHHLSPPNPNPNPSHFQWSSLLCKHSPSATLDILILILVVFSGAFLIYSYFSDVSKSLSLSLPSISLSLSTITHIVFLLGFVLFFVASVISIEVCSSRMRKCGRRGCKGLKKAVEFDLQVQSEECLRSEGAEESVREIDELPWKGGSESNPDYECLRMELRKMAPMNGRAVLLFRAKCGCPVAKLEGWGAKRGRRHKKTLALTGRGDHR